MWKIEYLKSLSVWRLTYQEMPVAQLDLAATRLVDLLNAYEYLLGQALGACPEDLAEVWDGQRLAAIHQAAGLTDDRNAV